MSNSNVREVKLKNKNTQITINEIFTKEISNGKIDKYSKGVGRRNTMILIELKRAIKNKKFLVAVLIGIIIASISVYLYIKEYIFFNYNAYDLQTPEAQEKAKLLVEGGLNKYSVWTSQFRLFVVTMPIISVIPFGLSYLEDSEYGIIKNIDIRIKHKKYILSKILVNGITGGIAIIIPTVVMTILVFLIFKGDIVDSFGYGTFGGPFASIYSENFQLYLFLHIIINFVFGFAYGNIGLAVSAYLKNKIAIILSPFLFWIFGSIICSFLNIIHYSTATINQFYISPMVTIHEIIIELFFIFILSSTIFYFKSRKSDIYEC